MPKRKVQQLTKKEIENLLSQQTKVILNAVDERLGRMEFRLAAVEERLGKVEERLGKMEFRIN